MEAYSMEMENRIYSYIRERGSACEVMMASSAVYLMNDIHEYVEPDIYFA